MKKVFVIFISIFVAMVFFNLTNVHAYGEKIEGYQTQYELQNQYVNGEYIFLEGFYFVSTLQNFTDSSKITGTHYYKIQISNGTKSYVYYDTGNYYVDLTNIEFLQGVPWITPGESDIASPLHPEYNYRYRDVGFQFMIPISDLTNFDGPSTDWNVSISCVARNTYKGKFVEWEFKQNNIYSSKKFASFEKGDYEFLANTSLENYSSVIIADYAYVRSSPGKNADNLNRVIYNGSYLYWGYNQRFNNLSVNTILNTGADKVTWYRLSYGNIYYSSGYRAAYAANSSSFGWIPSVFFGSTSGTPYSIKVTNIPPKINALDKKFNEGTLITPELLLENVTASDYSFGTKIPEIKITDLSLNSDRNKVAKYNVTFWVEDTKKVSSQKSIIVDIVNVIPQIKVKDIIDFNYGETITQEKILEGLIQAYDVFDGDITDQVYIKDYGGLVVGASDNPYKEYKIIFGVKDSNGAEGTAVLKLKISYKYIRSINSNYLYTLNQKSKWKNPELYEKLEYILNNDSGQENKCEQIWEFTNQQRIEVQKDQVRGIDK